MNVKQPDVGVWSVSVAFSSLFTLFFSIVPNDKKYFQMCIFSLEIKHSRKSQDVDIIQFAYVQSHQTFTGISQVLQERDLEPTALHGAALQQVRWRVSIYR